MTTTINNYNVKLSLDASNYINSSLMARNETSRLRRMIESAKTPLEIYENKLGLLDRALAKGAISQQTYNRAVSHLKSSLNVSSASTENLTSSVLKLAAAWKVFDSIRSFLTSSVKLYAETETAAVAFEVLTKSMDGAQDLISGLRGLAAVTPLTFTNTQRAARTLLAFGVESNRIMPTLKMLGDITGGVASRFEMMSLAFAQMESTGRLQGQDLLQMVNAGFNPLQEISKKTGESLLTLRKRMEAGAISAEEVAAAFKSATSAGGDFFGMIDKMSQTTEGRVAQLTDAWQQLQRTIGQSILNDAMVAQVEGLESFIRGLDSGLRAIGSGDIQFGKMISYGTLVPTLSEELSAKSIAEQNAFLQEQLRLRRAGLPTMGKAENELRLAREAAAEQRRQDRSIDISGPIESAVVAGISSIKEGANGLQALLQATVQSAQIISGTGIATTQELITKLQAGDPEVSALEVGTQEAFRAMNEWRNLADRQQEVKAKNAEILAQNAQAQRDKINQWLSIINDTFKANGFNRIR